MKVMFPALKYDYGQPSRGISMERAFFLPALQRAASPVIPFWLEDNGYPQALESLQRKLLEEAEKIKPDVIVFILMNNEVRIETIAELSQRYITMNWFADDQWRFDSFTRLVAPYFTYAITVDKYSIPAYRAIGCRNVILSQWACPKVPAEIDGTQAFEHDVCFIGSRNSVREWYIESLARAAIRVDCYGAGWPAGRVGYNEMGHIFRSSRICLNLSNSQPRDMAFGRHVCKKMARAALGLERGEDPYPRSVRRALAGLYNHFFGAKRSESIKARNFEIPAWGGFQISQFALEIEDYFMPGKEILLFSCIEELVRLIRYYLENDEQRETIRRAGAVRAAEHDYERRMKAIIERIEHDTGHIFRS